MVAEKKLPVYVIVIIVFTILLSIICTLIRIYHECCEEDETATANPENVIFIGNARTTNIIIEMPIQPTDEEVPTRSSRSFQSSPTCSTRNSPRPSAPPRNQTRDSDDPPSYNDVMDGFYGHKK